MNAELAYIVDTDVPESRSWLQIGTIMSAGGAGRGKYRGKRDARPYGLRPAAQDGQGAEIATALAAMGDLHL